MPNTNNTRRFTMNKPVLFNGQYYPSTIMPIDDGNGNIQDTTVFADRAGNYFTSNGQNVILQGSLPEVVVHPKEPTQGEMLANVFNNYLTMSNDRTKVNYVPHREYNTHLREGEIQGAKSNALWEKEHPNLASWGYAASAIPFAVAAYPFLAVSGEALTGSALGNTINTNITSPLVEAAMQSQWLPYSNAAATSYFGAEGLNDVRNGKFTPETAMELTPLISPYSLMAKQVANEAWHSKWAQYPRYYAGKLYYGNNVELPTLYRKLNDLPSVENNRIVLTNPNSRFAYKNGTDSPIITNMTTDVPVRSHGNGNWDLDNVLAFPGKTLLGKNVISTRPSDTFTFGDNITVSPSKVTFFSGSDDAVKAARNMGMQAKVSEESKKILDTYNKTIEESTNPFISRLIKIDGKGYSKGIQQLTRNSFKSPTVKDYKFMDWVFQPQYKNEVFPFRNLSKMKTFKELQSLPTQISSQFGDARMRNYLLDPTEWRNVIYDPATTAEGLFRKRKGIELKSHIYK